MPPTQRTHLASPPPRPLDGYVRVSRVGARNKKDGFISPDIQTQGLEAWSQRTGIPVVIHPAELDRSGGTMDRPVFNELMDRVRSGESGGIVVYKIDRFARTLVGALNTLAELGEHDASFASCCEQVSYTTSQERAFLQMQFIFAELVRTSLAEGWAEVTANAVLTKGLHISNHVPFGFVKLGKSQPYDLNEKEAALVHRVFRLRAEGTSWRQLAQFLDSEAPQPDGRRWHIPRLQRMVANRVYLGEASYGQHCNPSAHPAIVSEAEFQKAQDVRGVPLPRRSEKPPMLLAGLARCASCRYTLKEGSGGRKGKRVRIYHCNNKAVAGRCPACQSIVGDAFESYVVELFKAELRGVHGRAMPACEDLDVARAELDLATFELNAFTSDLEAADRLRAAGAYQQGLEVRLARVEDAQQAVGALQPALAGDLALEDWNFDIDAWWENADDQVRMKALNAALDAVFLRGPSRGPLKDRVLLLWRGQAPDDLPRRGRDNGSLRGFAW